MKDEKVDMDDYRDECAETDMLHAEVERLTQLVRLYRNDYEVEQRKRLAAEKSLADIVGK